ncbi:cytochrome P450 [Nocardia sp. NBC_00565]|uniref:cytochrome P450 n=1 Tax=Nocardia sp. NBC_00565 TaxID=2975993 RepID=UPI002E802EC6|nr:cytochrome P450 [Nocardia sp. NBC_00565]WUC02715.1 cytochrome P450 [Nocardia sp. NBC_00565]
MTNPHYPSHTQSGPVDYGSPNGGDGPRVSMYSPDFAADPHRAYREMRTQYGSLVPVDLAPGVPATLVIGYYTAIRVLHDHDHFPADPRTWQKNIPADCPILPMLGWRPIASRSAGAEYERYRQAITASIDEVDLHALHDTVEQIAVQRINTFCQAGTADLIRQYAFPVAFEVVNLLLGCPLEIGQRAATAMAAMFEGIDADSGNEMLSEALRELIALKRAEPGDDITSRLLRHPARLDEAEMLHQVAGFYAAAFELQQNLTANTLLLILTDDRFAGDVLAGSLSTRDALDEVLFSDPPLANFCASYPRQPILINDAWLPAHQPVLVSMAGCNNDPAIRTGDHTGNRSHLAWGLGPHACPARSMAYLIAEDAIHQLLDALPEMRLAVPVGEIAWRPGPFHRALAVLPVDFSPTSPMTAF